MKKIILLICALFYYHLMTIAGDEKTIVNAVLKSAIVYRSGAELTHTVKTTLKQGSNELVVEGLSNGLEINSVQIGCDQQITIMSVEFSANYLRPIIKTAVEKRLEDSLTTLNKELIKLEILIKTSNDLQEVLKSNRELRGSQTGVSVAELTKMMEYYKSKTLEMQTDISQYREKETLINGNIQKLRSQLEEEEQKNNKTSGRLILQLVSPVGGQNILTISYITNKANWNPAYDVRVESISKPIKLMYKAKLIQTTGIDWKQVKLTLATSAPNQNNNAPVLKSWFLKYVDPIALMENNLYMNSIQSSLNGKAAGLSEVVVTGYAKRKDEEEENTPHIQLRGVSGLAAQPLYVLNGNLVNKEEVDRIDPKNIKNITVLKDKEATSMYGTRAGAGVIVVTLKDELSDYITMTDNELNVTFDIDIPYDVPGNGKEQMVSLKEYAVNTLFKYYSVPKLDKDAYLLGEWADWEKLNLLPGEANIIFEGTYIGKSFIDPNSTQDTMNLTLGKDKRIVVKKEKLKDFSSIKFLASNKKQIVTYEITVKNNKQENTTMLLKDQYPLSTNKDIEIELLEKSGATDNKELGVLTWKMDLAAGELKKVRVSYSIKYPKDKYVNLGQ